MVPGVKLEPAYDDDDDDDDDGDDGDNCDDCDDCDHCVCTHVYAEAGIHSKRFFVCLF